MAPRRRRDDSVGSIAEKGCVKCCSYCRLSPMGSAVCYSGVIIGVLTFVLYLFGAGLSSAAEKTNPDGDCSSSVPDLHITDVYTVYLQYTGIPLFFLILAVPMSCCVCCGCCCGFPKNVKIAACILAIPVSLFIGTFVGWMFFGTYLVVVMDPGDRNKTICRNIQTYIIIMYIFFICFILFGLIIAIWRIHKSVKDSSGSSSTTASAAERGAQADTEKQLKNMQRGAKLMKAMA